uniref:Uncharacterized protein n=1 Tax=Haptolina brevifila TaxID=156173 RepID=A0A6U7M6R7_9EUKA|mmetsp:Transcript_77671/g.154291  ORF Transcript_77671/g.154291 Transcript_77671/m.154291 type:complete len:509 (+) Transcript_77671:2-1528(+)
MSRLPGVLDVQLVARSGPSTLDAVLHSDAARAVSSAAYLVHQQATPSQPSWDLEWIVLSEASPGSPDMYTAHPSGQPRVLLLQARPFRPAQGQSQQGGSSARGTSDRLDAGTIEQVDGRQLYVDTNGWVGVASEGESSNTDAARRTWRMSPSGDLELADGRLLHATKDGWVCVSQSAKESIQTSQRVWALEGGTDHPVQQWKIVLRDDGLCLYVNSAGRASVVTSAEDVSAARLAWSVPMTWAATVVEPVKLHRMKCPLDPQPLGLTEYHQTYNAELRLLSKLTHPKTIRCIQCNSKEAVRGSNGDRCEPCFKLAEAEYGNVVFNLYVNSNGWASIERDFEFTGQDKTASCGFTFKGGVLTFPSGGQLFAHEQDDWCAQAAVEGEGANTDPKRRQWTFDEDTWILSLQDGRELYVDGDKNVRVGSPERSTAWQIRTRGAVAMLVAVSFGTYRKWRKFGARLAFSEAPFEEKDEFDVWTKTGRLADKYKGPRCDKCDQMHPTAQCPWFK